jgi:hypothetical protein
VRPFLCPVSNSYVYLYIFCATFSNSYVYLSGFEFTCTHDNTYAYLYIFCATIPWSIKADVAGAVTQAKAYLEMNGTAPDDAAQAYQRRQSAGGSSTDAAPWMQHHGGSTMGTVWPIQPVWQQSGWHAAPWHQAHTDWQSTWAPWMQYEHHPHMADPQMMPNTFMQPTWGYAQQSKHRDTSDDSSESDGSAPADLRCDARSAMHADPRQPSARGAAHAPSAPPAHAHGPRQPSFPPAHARSATAVAEKSDSPSESEAESLAGLDNLSAACQAMKSEPVKSVKSLLAYAVAEKSESEDAEPDDAEDVAASGTKACSRPQSAARSAHAVAIPVKAERCADASPVKAEKSQPRQPRHSPPHARAKARECTGLIVVKADPKKKGLQASPKGSPSEVPRLQAIPKKQLLQASPKGSPKGDAALKEALSAQVAACRLSEQTGLKLLSPVECEELMATFKFNNFARAKTVSKMPEVEVVHALEKFGLDSIAARAQKEHWTGLDLCTFTADRVIDMQKSMQRDGPAFPLFIDFMTQLFRVPEEAAKQRMLAASRLELYHRTAASAKKRALSCDSVLKVAERSRNRPSE